MDQNCINYKKLCFNNYERYVWKNIQNFFLYWVTGNMQVIWVTSEGVYHWEDLVSESIKRIERKTWKMG